MTIFSGTAIDDHYSVTNTTSGNTDVLSGDAGNDTLSDDNAASVFGSGSATVSGNSIQISGGAGNDTLQSYNQSSAGNGAVTSVSANTTVIDGGPDPDSIYGGNYAYGYNIGSTATVSGNQTTVNGGAGGGPVSFGNYAQAYSGATATNSGNTLDLTGGDDYDYSLNVSSAAYADGAGAHATVASNHISLSGGASYDYLNANLYVNAFSGGIADFSNNTVSVDAGSDGGQIYEYVSSSLSGSGSSATISGNTLTLSGGTGGDYLALQISGAAFDGASLVISGNSITFNAGAGYDNASNNFSTFAYNGGITTYSGNTVQINGGDDGDSLGTSFNVDAVGSGSVATVSGNDITLSGGLGDDYLSSSFSLSSGSGGVATVTGNSVTLDGGDGYDTAYIYRQSISSDITADFSSTYDQTLSDGTTLVGIERVGVYSGFGNDTLTGGTADDQFDGGLGSDTLVGNGGNDNLSSNINANYNETRSGDVDHLEGGAGNDSLYAITSASAFDAGSHATASHNTAVLSGGTDNDSLQYNSNAQAYFGGNAINSDNTASLSGDAGYDNFYGNVSATAFQSGSSATTSHTTLVASGGSESDFLSGGMSAQAYFGGIVTVSDNSITLEGGTGNDTIFGTISSYSDAGSTVVIAGNSITLDGGDDGDYLQFQGNDTSGNTVSLLGGAGNDNLSLYASSFGNTVSLDGGDGTDTAQIHYTGSSNISVDFSASYNISAFGLTVGNIEQVAFYSGSGNDTLIGGAESDTLDGGNGSDNIGGGAGNDSLFASTSVFAFSNGNVTLSGNIDTLSGDAGADYLTVNNNAYADYQATATVSGNLATISGGLDGDTINVTNSATTYFGTASTSYNETTADGGDGNDTLYSSNSAYTYFWAGGSAEASHNITNLSGGLGNDRLQASNNVSGTATVTDNSVTLDGGDGDDYLSIQNSGTTGNTATLLGGAGNDTLVSYDGPGNTVTLDGGADFDAAEIHRESASTAFVLDLSNTDPQTLSDGTAIRNIERVTFWSGSGDDQLTGGAGDDNLYAGGGSDILTGGSGNNYLDGGDGYDTAVFTGARSGYQVTQNWWNGSLTIRDRSSGETSTVVNVESFQFGANSYDLGYLLTNHAPQVTGPVNGGTTSEDAAAATVDLLQNASDPDGDPLSVSPGSVSVSVTDGVWGSPVAWTVDGAGHLALNPGQFNALAEGAHVKLTFSYQLGDGFGGTAPQTATLTVNGVNDAPVAVADSGFAGENDTRLFDVVANDTDVDTGDTRSLTALGAVTVTSANGAVNGIDASSAFSITGGKVQFAPGTLFDHLNDRETASVVVNYTVQDGQGATSSSTLTLTLNGANDGPVAVADTGSAGENETRLFDVVANDTDVDTRDTRSLTALGAVTVTSANGAVNGIDASSAFSIAGGKVQFNPGTLFDHLGLGDTASVAVNYTIRDGQGASSSSTLTLTVSGANDAPIITSQGGGDTATASVAENSTLVTTLAATDIDSGQTFSWSITGGEDQALFQIVNGNELRFVSAPNFESLPGAGATPGYQVTVQVSDGAGGTDTQTLTVTVTDQNDVAATITSGGTASVAENIAAASVVYDANAADPDTVGTVTFSLTGADAARFSIDADDGEVRFLASPDFEAPGDAGGNHVYDIAVHASDGVHDTIKAVAITVTDQNDVAATITSGGTASVAENTAALTVVYDANATDPDTVGSVAFSLTGADAARFSIDADDGEMRFLSSPDFDAPGDAGGNNVYDVVVHANDGVHDTTRAVAISVTNSVGETWSGGNQDQNHTGTAEEDNLTGGNGKDILDGGAGNDTISGGNGKDILTGGRGDDKLTGGNGADTFVFAASFGKDLIADFKPSEDVIQFDHALFANFAAVQSHAANDGHGNTVITLDASDTITLQGVTVVQLHANDFLFV